ncbi:MAG TPA: PD-(D/E)XK nuclease family protein [Acidiferrobacter sp.]|nr:PD-(D/E)XK nuclease family protein [Acidiferrobacter sp.]
MLLKSANEFTKDSDRELFAALAAGATVVTANNRLARQITILWGEAERAHGRSAWESPDVLPWTAYIRRTADGVREGLATPFAPLSDAQERWLWADLVQARDAGFLCSDQSFGDLAAKAWVLLADYGEPVPAGDGSPEVEAFVALARAFTDRLRTMKREDRARDGARVVAALRGGALAPPVMLAWAGFQRLTPIQTQVSDACLAAGGAVTILGLPRGQAELRARVFPTVENELTAALLWAQDALSRNADGRYAIVVPELERYRLPMMRMADEVFAATTPAGVRPYEFSLGAPLADAPVVSTALQVWRLLQGPLAAMDAARLLQSPFIAGVHSPRAVCARLAYKALDGGVSLGLQDMADLARSLEARDWSALLLTLKRRVRAWPRRARPSVWAGLVMDALSVLGWPGRASYAEYQAVAALRDVLESVAGLDAVAAPMSYGLAITTIQAALVERVFQPGGEGEARLQIMGPLEAVGLPFAGLWVANLHDGVWPTMRQPHPLLPLAFQREHHFPHAHLEDDVHYAEALTEYFAAAAPEVYLSAAHHDGKDPQRPSRLLANFAPEVGAAPVFVGRAGRIFAARSPLEQMPEGSVPLAAPRARGYGTGLFAAQASCPFKAASQYRLQAEALAPPTYGLSAAARGGVVHAALEQLFQALPDQATLTALSSDEKEERISAAVAHAIAGADRDYGALPRAFVALEVRRYQDLVRDFLVLEESRPPFSVRACEQEVDFPCGDITARVRIDRVDEVAGGLVLIDYKTGKPPVLDLTSERPVYPQLLVYATALGEDVAGIAYAALSPRGSYYKAWVRAADLLPGAMVVPEWESQVTAWPVILRRLADEFSVGRVAVAPEAGACDYCGREGFCRIGERGRDDNG